MIDLAARRLQKVVVENKDFEKLIKQYDRPVSFFYCDPPYFATESYYKDVGFTAKDHIRLRDTLLRDQRQDSWFRTMTVRRSVRYGTSLIFTLRR